MITRALRTRPWTWLVGRLRWSGPLLTAHGEPEHARAMARGATRSESEQRYRDLVEHLPLTAGPVAPAGEPAEGPAEARKERVLLVEDDELVRSLVGQALEGHGYEVAAASGGAEALELFNGSAEPPALVVTDIVMPGISGAELARALRERRPGLPVLFTSGYAKQLIDERDLHDGTAFLPKPFSIADVSAAVRSLLDGGGRREGAGEVLARAGGAF